MGEGEGWGETRLDWLILLFTLPFLPSVKGGESDFECVIVYIVPGFKTRCDRMQSRVSNCERLYLVNRFRLKMESGIFLIDGFR